MSDVLIPSQRGKSFKGNPAGNIHRGSEVLIPSQRGKSFKAWLDAQEAIDTERLNPLSTGQILQSNNIIENAKEQGLNPLSTGQILQSRNEKGHIVAVTRVLIPSQRGKSFKVRTGATSKAKLLS